MTFGDATTGTDGGVFVEFSTPAESAGPIPKYTLFPNDTVALDFCKYWFGHYANRDNYVQLVAARASSAGWMGGTSADSNISIIALEAHTGIHKEAKMKDTVVHELGHQFGVSGAHVDSNEAYTNHEGTDDCLMTYHSDDTDGISEFCTDCIYEVRDATAPR